MPAELQSVLDAALQLSTADREALAERLWESLDDEELAADDDGDFGEHPFAAEWDEEIRRRVEDMRSGKEPGIPWEQVRKLLQEDAEFEAKLGRRAEEPNRDPSVLIPWDQVREMR